MDLFYAPQKSRESLILKEAYIPNVVQVMISFFLTVPIYGIS